MAGRSAGPTAPPSKNASAEPSPEEVRAQLAKIMESRVFVQSGRLRRFLEFTIGLTLAGNSERIKEYALGRDVFDRDQTFDPQVDSIVRVEARRLRRKLREYYLEASRGDAVLIEYPQGSYVPQFSYFTPAAARPALIHFKTPEPQTLNPKTVAVLPFLNLSPDPGQDFFCDGITEEILNTLASVPELSVVARTSVFYFKGLHVDVREIGERLGAGTVIEGSVRTAGDRLRITAKVIDAAKGLLLWSGTFDREVADIFAVQDEIARALADSLRVSLAPPPAESAPRGKRDLEAYTGYLKGCHYWNHVSQEGIQSALNEFNRSISLFPSYAPPYAGLANVYGHLTFWGTLPPGDGIAKAKQAANEALRLDAGIAGAYSVLGLIASCFEWRWREGEELLKRALELQPSNMTAHTYYALHLLCRARFEEVELALDKSAQLDPLSPWSFRNQGWYYYFQRQYDQAIEALNTSLILDPRFREAQFMLAYAYMRDGRYDDAIAQLLELPAGAYEAVRWGALGEAYAGAGKRVLAEEALQQLGVLAATGYVSPMNRLAIYAGLGDWGRMFEQMRQACDDHCPWLCLMKVDPRYDPIRADPRFAEILKRMDLS